MGTAPPQTPPHLEWICQSVPTVAASILASSALDLRPRPQCSSGITAHAPACTWARLATAAFSATQQSVRDRRDVLGVAIAPSICAKHLTVESYTVVMLRTVILIISSSIPSPLTPSFQA